MAEGTTVRIRPRPLIVKNVLLSAIFGGLPLFGVLFWLSITQGNWGHVAIAFAVFLAAITVAVARFYAGHVDVTSTTIDKVAFAKRTVVPVAEVATTSIGHTYRGSSHETLPQFVAKDAQGTVLFRLRGLYWSEEDMITVARAIGARHEVDTEPMTLKEFYERSPGAAYWYEGKPWVGIAGIAVAFVAALALVGWLMDAIGLPLAFGLAF